MSQIKFWPFATASFDCGQLQTVLFKDGLYRIAALKYLYVPKCLGEL